MSTCASAMGGCITESESEVVFRYSTQDLVHSVPSTHGQDPHSPLDALLLKKWVEAKEAGSFNYSTDDVQTKILPGKFGIVAQMNSNRKMKRRKPDEIFEIEQQVNHSKFNFTKIQEKEKLSKILFVEAELQNDGGRKEGGSVTLEGDLIINNAPICHSHSLLVPFLPACLPQVLEYQGLKLAIHTVLQSKSPDMKVVFNSLGGFASVNHLHFHLYYLPFPTYTETAECERLAGPCYTFKDHYAPGFVFQLNDGEVDQLVSSVMALVNMFLKEKVAHNLFITRGAPLDTSLTPTRTYTTVRACLWARNFESGAKEVDLLVAAACELAGHVPIYSRQGWENLSEEDLLPHITSACLKKYEAMLPKVADVFSMPNGIM